MKRAGRPLAVGDTCYLGHKIHTEEDLVRHSDGIVRCLGCVIVARHEREAIRTATAERRARDRGSAPYTGRA